jgi:HPt (histidine-containing phosphotransfer) domain-containing protein
MRGKMTKNNQRIGFTKDQMIQFLKIFQHNTDTMLEMEEQNYENNKKYMAMEQQLFHEKWKCRYLVRRIKNIAKHYGVPDLAVTEEELDDQIKRSEN